MPKKKRKNCKNKKRRGKKKSQNRSASKLNKENLPTSKSKRDWPKNTVSVKSSGFMRRIKKL
jgi:hypothetical protein